MCGIFRSTEKKEFNKQYKLNLTRGASAFSGLFFNRGKASVFKTEDTRYCPYFPADEYLGHLRAPTGSSREFSTVHSHPFEYRDWIVAHNGIITNTKVLTDAINGTEKDYYYQVDSSLIPVLLHWRGWEAFNMLRGTWACWMYNRSTKEMYITRSDNTLFVNPDTGDFSSAPIEGYDPLPERKVFKLTGKTYEQVSSYNTKPTYFVP